MKALYERTQNLQAESVAAISRRESRGFSSNTPSCADSRFRSAPCLQRNAPSSSSRVNCASPMSR